MSHHLQPQPKQIPSFLIWVFGYTWGFWLATILLKHLQVFPPGSPFLTIMVVIGSFGPAFGTILTLKLKLRQLPGFIFSGRRGTGFYLLLFCAGLLLAFGLPSAGLFPIENLVGLPLTFAFVLFMGGGNEELGWRGFLQPALEKKFSFWPSNLIISLVWGFWHLPLWWIDRGHTSFLLFLALVFIMTLWHSALYKRTQSIFACMVFHALINHLGVIFKGTDKVMTVFDLSQFNPPLFIVLLLTTIVLAVWLWYSSHRQDLKEKAGP